VIYVLKDMLLEELLMQKEFPLVKKIIEESFVMKKYVLTIVPITEYA